MKLSRDTAEIYCPDGVDEDVALGSTTHLGVGAHPDDLEILAIHGILECFRNHESSFCGVVVTDGAGSARVENYADYSDEQMRRVRREEQRAAAQLGQYGAQILLDHSSQATKDAALYDVKNDLRAVLEATRPRVVYTHNLCDRHDTHVAVALRTIAALRTLPKELQPEQVIGCEVWCDLDWLPEELKVKMDVTERDHLQMALLGVFDSQVAGGKRYDLAVAGRRRAHATFGSSHGVDESRGVVYGMDLTALVRDTELEPREFAERALDAFAALVRDRLSKLQTP